MTRSRLGFGFATLILCCVSWAACRPDVASNDPGLFDFAPTGEVVAGTSTVWQLTYRAGPSGVAAGGRLLLRFPHPYYFMAPLNWFPGPAKNGVPPVTAETSSGAPVEVSVDARGWHPNPVEAFLPEGLQPGEILRISVGSDDPVRPSLAPRYSCSSFAPLLLADVTGSGTLVPVPTTGSVTVRADEPVGLELIVPSQALIGQPIPMTIRLRDRLGNIASPVRPLSVEIGIGLDWESEERIQVTFAAGDPGWRDLDGPVPPKVGVLRIVGRSELSAEAVQSNPVRIVDSLPELQVLWADLHGHSHFSDGTGGPDDYYRTARGPAALDVAALSDHEWQLVENEWHEMQGLCRSFEAAGDFVPLLAWEFSLGGHRVVYSKSCSYQPPHAAFDGPKELWQIEYNHDQIHAWSHDQKGLPLRDYGNSQQLLMSHRDLQALVIPHTSATWHMGNDWDSFDPTITPLVEIYSAHGSSEATGSPRPVSLFVDRGSVRTALARGYRLGFIACGDSHDGKPGLTLSGPHSGGLTAILAPQLDRDAVWTALADRHTWATTGARILLDLEVNDSAMGSVVRCVGPPRVNFEVHGTNIVDTVEVISEGRVVHTLSPAALDVIGAFSDTDFDGLSYYYLRVTQRDGQMAWSSPLWVSSPALPMISDLQARPVSDGVEIDWTAKVGLEYGKFELLRRRGDDGRMDLDRYHHLAELEASDGRIAFVDRKPAGPGITTYYALTWTATGRSGPDGSSAVLLGLVSAEGRPVTQTTPDGPAINYFLEEPGEITIEITDLTLQVVRRIEIEQQNPGLHHYVWDGRDDDGALCRGLHMGVITSAGGSTQRKPLRTGPDGSERTLLAVDPS